MLEKNAIIVNLITYIVLLLPSIIYIVFKKTFSNKKEVLYTMAILILIQAILSSILYIFSNKIFSLFIKKTGTINMSVFISRIVFLGSSLYPLKIIIPTYFSNNSNKKTVILITTKITVTIFFSILGYLLFSTVGLLYSFPISDIIYYVILISLFSKSNNC